MDEELVRRIQDRLEAELSEFYGDPTLNLRLPEVFAQAFMACLDELGGQAREGKVDGILIPVPAKQVEEESDGDL